MGSSGFWYTASAGASQDGETKTDDLRTVVTGTTRGIEYALDEIRTSGFVSNTDSSLESVKLMLIILWFGRSRSSDPQNTTEVVGVSCLVSLASVFEEQPPDADFSPCPSTSYSWEIMGTQAWSAKQMRTTSCMALIE